MDRKSEFSIPHVAIACGGTGGHLFPGVAVAGELKQLGCRVTLLISPKEIDQLAVKSATGFAVKTLPAIGLTRGNRLGFAWGAFKSLQASRNIFRNDSLHAVLAMGGFTSAPPVLAGKLRGAATFLHESNTIPGKANRWLSRVVDTAFVGFAAAGKRLHTSDVKVVGTPVRPQFYHLSAKTCRGALGLDPNRPVLVVTGGSQGASGINDLVIRLLPLLATRMPQIQLVHLTGPTDTDKVRTACEAAKLHAQVFPFHPQMDLVLGAATVVISRAGASSIAEIAAVGVPAILVPFPAATDDHQFFNAQALAQTGAAILCEQKSADPANVADEIVRLASEGELRDRTIAALAQWSFPQAAEQIARTILQAIESRQPSPKAFVPHLVNL